MGQIVVPLDSIDFGQTTDLDRALCRPERDDDVTNRFLLISLNYFDM